MNPNPIIEARRQKISAFLVTYSDKDKKDLVRLARKENLYQKSINDDEIYDSLVRFAKAHDIKIHQEHVRANREFIEKINEEGKSELVDVLSPKNQKTLVECLKMEREALSQRILDINKLLKHYEK